MLMTMPTTAWTICEAMPNRTGRVPTENDAMKCATRQPGMTLVELLVVLTIIGIILLLVLPNMGAILAGGAETQTRNLIDAQIKVARSLAIRDRKYTCLHFQKHATGREEYWCAILQESPTGFVLAEGTEPTKLPDGMVVGEVSEYKEVYPGAGVWDGFVAPGPSGMDEFKPDALGDTNPEIAARKLSDFTTITILFDPNGRRVTRPTGVIYSTDDNPDPLPDSDPNEKSRTLLFDTRPASDPPADDDQRLFVKPPSTARDDEPFDADRDPDKWPDWDPKNGPEIWNGRFVHPQHEGTDANYDYFADEQAVSAVCVFRTDEYVKLRGDPDRLADYLNESARFLPVAPYVGGLIRSSAE